MRSLTILPWAVYDQWGGHSVLPFVLISISVRWTWSSLSAVTTGVLRSDSHASSQTPRDLPPPSPTPPPPALLSHFTDQPRTMPRSWHCPELPFHTWRTRQESVSESVSLAGDSPFGWLAPGWSTQEEGQRVRTWNHTHLFTADPRWRTRIQNQPK